MMGIPDIRLLSQVDFEVFGHVQGLGFTKYVRDLCTKAGIRGWVKNSKRGTIVGKMQGPKDEVDKMVEWLSNVGCPGSKIEKCELTNWGTVSKYGYVDFSIRF